MKTVMKTNHFALRDREIVYVPDVPEKPFMFDVWYTPGEAMSQGNRILLSRYMMDLQSAIKSGDVVENQEEVFNQLLKNNALMDKNTDGIIYSLQCRVKRKYKQVRDNRGFVIDYIVVARVNFDEQPEKECPICEGSGEVQQTDVDWDDCRRCNGTGKVQPEAAGQEQEEILSDFLLWVEMNTHYFEDKDVTPSQVAHAYLTRKNPQNH